MSYTPGPWRAQIEPNEDSCMGALVYTIHEMKETDILGLAKLINYKKLDPVLEANARLIAAAPELLESLKEVARVLKAFSCSNVLGQTQMKRLNRAVAVIAKVEGRSS